MSKKAINLIIKKDKESLLVVRLRKILPLAGMISLAFFLILYIGSIFYIKYYSVKINNISKEVFELEQEVNQQISKEGIYLAISKLTTILAQLTKQNGKQFADLIPLLLSLKTEEVAIQSASIGSDNKITFLLSAPTYDRLYSFMENIISAEVNDKIISQVVSHGITRDINGTYTISVSFNAS